jgi:hypothetical protein
MSSDVQCWSMSKDGPEQAERLLDNMKTRSSAVNGMVDPNCMTYTSVMDLVQK